ncbi:MAG: GCN5-related N-acetyltransferase [Frankiales bacterium]|nr:GCN5-related N-acetyltransferase [Frankiales bacterium]
MSSSPSAGVALVHLDRAGFAFRRDEILDVYAEAMEVRSESARSRRSILAGHMNADGLRAVAALDGARMVGIAYGYLGVPGQWWHDQVRAALPEATATAWLDGAFEVCELHVRPAHQGTGLGRALLAELLREVPARTAALTTPDLDTRARRFYKAGGWVDLAVGLRFPGDPRVFAVLGLALPDDRPRLAPPGAASRAEP